MQRKRKGRVVKDPPNFLGVVMWSLRHTREWNFWISCGSYERAIKEFYRQWRDDDGSIPWEIVYEP